jgi:hypothetical protein
VGLGAAPRVPSSGTYFTGCASLARLDETPALKCMNPSWSVTWGTRKYCTWPSFANLQGPASMIYQETNQGFASALATAHMSFTRYPNGQGTDTHGCERQAQAGCRYALRYGRYCSTSRRPLHPPPLCQTCRDVRNDIYHFLGLSEVWAVASG